MQNKKVFGAVRATTLAALCAGGLMLMTACASSAEKSCGEGKCGADKAAEKSCGEGKCGADKAGEKSCGEGKCGADKAGEKKCGEGSCG